MLSFLNKLIIQLIMRETVSSMDLHYMIREFQDLIGSRVDKIYHRKDELVIQLYSAKTKKSFLFFKLPSTIMLSSKKPDSDDSAGGFCMFLRKKINLFRIESVEQIKFERIIKIRFSKNEEKYDLIVELFSPGNILLNDLNGKILSMQNSLITANRTIRGGVEYFPLLRDYNPLTDSLIEVFAKSDKDNIVKTLAMDLGFGGFYSEKICTMANVDKNKDKPTADEVKKIENAIHELKDYEINPVKIDDEILPFGEGEIIGNSFSRAVADNLIEGLTGKKEVQKKKDQDSAVKKIERIIARQVKQIANLGKDSDELQRKGELIYENYSHIEELLKTINDAKKKYSYKEISEKLKDKGLILSLNEKEQTITINL